MQFQFWGQGLYIASLRVLGSYDSTHCSYLRHKHTLSMNDFVISIYEVRFPSSALEHCR